MTRIASEDRMILDRAFGPEIADEGFLSALEPVRAVSWLGAGGRAAVDMLLRSCIHSGLGRQPLGWTLQVEGPTTTLSVMFAKQALGA